MTMFSMWKYLDNAALVVGAIIGYLSHWDERKLIVDISNQLIAAVEETVPIEVLQRIDTDKIMEGVRNIVDGFKPLLVQGRQSAEAPPEIRVPR